VVVSAFLDALRQVKENALAPLSLFEPDVQRNGELCTGYPVASDAGDDEGYDTLNIPRAYVARHEP
jgi:hypothetical protein